MMIFTPTSIGPIQQLGSRGVKHHGLQELVHCIQCAIKIKSLGPMSRWPTIATAIAISIATFTVNNRPSSQQRGVRHVEGIIMVRDVDIKIENSASNQGSHRFI